MPSTKSTKPPAKDTKKTKAKGESKKKKLPESSPKVAVVPVVEEDENEWEDEENVEDDEQDSDSDSENGGVDEEGMERLMKALGEDGLNEFDQAMLEDDDEDDSGDEEAEEDVEEDELDDEDVEKLSDESESEEENQEDEEELVALDDEDVELEPDAVPQQKLEVDNEVALSRIRENIQLDPSIPWTETLVLSYPEKIDVDVNDDLNRELAFYKQALHGANQARQLAASHKFPFTRPSDYFAEMVKSDAHMERIRQRLLNESATIKKSEEKRREREGKKFGKQVQIEKLKEREKNKKDMEERLKGLKRKRKDLLETGGGQDGDDFDVAVEDAMADRPAKRSRPGAPGGKKITRQTRDKKFGFGGQGRRSKQNTKESTDNFDMGGSRKGGKGGKGGSGKGGKGGPKRPGKSRRMAARSK
ncbi:rRNA-processing protein EBP2 [Marasmius sp. AFHP31]|nr:rRNA-processing protein EBP2 [Marasmius sp. AFHP31]